MDIEIPRKTCIYCGKGKYREVLIKDPTKRRNQGFDAFTGVGGSVSFVVMECDSESCHNVQVFRSSPTDDHGYGT